MYFALKDVHEFMETRKGSDGLKIILGGQV